jgi:hypothetical protein
MGEDCSWIYIYIYIYNGWDVKVTHSDEWVTGLPLFWTVLFHCQRSISCGAHVADARI